MRKRLGERLLESGLVGQQQLAQALQAQQSTGEQLGRLLVRLGYVSDGDMLRLLCEDAGVPFTTLEGVEADPAYLGVVPDALAGAGAALPLGMKDGRLVIALADPLDVALVASIEQAIGQRIMAVGAPQARIAEALRRLQTGREANTPSKAPAVRVEAPADVAEPVGTNAEIVDELFRGGVSLGATDIHVEPTSDAVRVRYRVDGILQGGPVYPKALQGALLTRIKVMAGLNIAESRLPQDGRLRIQVTDRQIDLRISTFPTLHGEDLVLRVLDRSRVALRLERLGMEPDDLGLFREVLRRPHGLVLITGPTGSGKTTTLYSALAETNTGERCILTLEDPIEYELEGIRQSQIHPRAGLTFASGLRALLRHDPDVILVGEMRDQETAEIALSAAMTGHMVLTTLHTNSAASAIPRLLDMGVESFALASSLQLSVAQRLLRVLCKACREPTAVPPAVRERFGLGEGTLYHATGCEACHQTGYRGRMAVFELLPVTAAISGCIHDRTRADEIQRLAGRPTLLQAGLAKVRAGLTSLEEVLRVTAQ